MEEIKSYTQDSNSQENSSVKRIGNFIKDARLSRNQSIEELATNLKIGAHQLKAIEDGNFDQLPEEVFIKAMIRRISEKLKLDTESIMGEFNNEKKEVKLEEILTETIEESGEESGEEVSNESKKHSKIKNKNPLGFAIFVLISGIFGLLASSLIFNYLSEYFQNQTPKQEIIKEN